MASSELEGQPGAPGRPRTPRGLESGQGVEIDEKQLLEWGARIGAVARSECAPPFFFTHIIASLDAITGREALCFTGVAAARFAERYYCSQRTAKQVAQAMLGIYEGGGGKEEARRVLGFARWVYEALRRPVPHAETVTILDVLRCLT
jgi:hypothetical protein